MNILDLYSDKENNSSFLGNIFSRNKQGLILMRLRCYIFMAEGYNISENDERLTELKYTFSTKNGVYDYYLPYLVEDMCKNNDLNSMVTSWRPYPNSRGELVPSEIRNIYFLNREVPEVDNSTFKSLKRIDSIFEDKKDSEVKDIIKDVLDNNDITFDGYINMKDINWGRTFNLI